METTRRKLAEIVVTRPSVTVLTTSSTSTSTTGAPQWVQAGTFPIRRVYCVGRNYVDHVREMGEDPGRSPPVFFTKPADAVLDTYTAGEAAMVPYPPSSSDVHYEGELVVALGRGGLRWTVEEAQEAIFGHAVGCDLTRRDLQSLAKKEGKPWDVAKGFDWSAPLGPIVAQPVVPADAQLALDLRGPGAAGPQRRQCTTLQHMIWNVPQVLSHLSHYFRLQPGDVVFTGTPAGVGPVQVGDAITVSCTTEAPDGSRRDVLPPCQFTMGPPEEK